jgi:hypothetical protein
MSDKQDAPTIARLWGLCKAVLFYGVFVLGPYVLYEWIQEDFRPDAQAESLRDLYAVAPNGLGAISTTALLATMISGIGQMARTGELREFWRSQIPRLTRLRIASISAGGAIAGLFAYEVGQIFLPIGTFDVHDMIWTLPGALIGFVAVLALGSTLPSQGDDGIEGPER